MNTVKIEMDFSSALSLIKEGKRVSRKNWNGKDMWVGLAATPVHANHAIVDSGAMDRPFLFMKTVDDQYVPWVASQTDILADDWCVVSSKDE